MRAYLTEHGYDGLAGDDCGCLLSDLAPCNDPMIDCVAGYRVVGCTCDDCDGRGFHMLPGKKPEAMG